MTRWKKAGGAALLAAMFAACAEEPVGPCNDEYVPGILVEVVNRATGAAEAEGASGWVRDGSHVDALELPGPAMTPESWLPHRRMFAAWERPGTYEVHVEKAGFEPWTRQNVVVNPGTCSVHTAHLLAELVPLD